MPTLTGYPIIDAMIGIIIFAVFFVIGFFGNLAPSVVIGL